jgi:hypothetical protein
MEIAYNDDFGSDLTSEVRLQVDAGAMYYLMVGGNDSTGGKSRFVITLSQ